MSEEIKRLGEGLEELGLDPDEIQNMVQKVRGAPNIATARAHFQTFREAVRKVWKKKVFELHPDRNGGDDSSFKKIVEVMKILDAIEVKPRERLRPAHVFGQVVVVVQGFRDFAPENTQTEGQTFNYRIYSGG